MILSTSKSNTNTYNNNKWKNKKQGIKIKIVYVWSIETTKKKKEEKTRLEYITLFATFHQRKHKIKWRFSLFCDEYFTKKVRFYRSTLINEYARMMVTLLTGTEQQQQNNERKTATMTKTRKWLEFYCKLSTKCTHTQTYST